MPVCRLFVSRNAHPGVLRRTVVHDGVHAGFKLLDNVGVYKGRSVHEHILTES